MTLLTELTVANNQLSTLPPSFASCLALERLEIDGNRMLSLPAEIGALSRISHFQYVQNVALLSPPETILARGTQAIIEFLASIFFAKRTLRLDLSAMGLSTIPPEVLQLTALRRLVLDRNVLDFLPPEIGLMTGLQELSFADNSVTQLPSDI
eukprot:462886-Rhodomonas_salina.1